MYTNQEFLTTNTGAVAKLDQSENSMLGVKVSWIYIILFGSPPVFMTIGLLLLRDLHSKLQQLVLTNGSLLGNCSCVSTTYIFELEIIEVVHRTSRGI